MAIPVDFDRQPGRSAVEVGRASIEWVLVAKLEPTRARPEHLPQ
jgi:hypothetical protein